MFSSETSSDRAKGTYPMPKDEPSRTSRLDKREQAEADVSEWMNNKGPYVLGTVLFLIIAFFIVSMFI